MIDPSRTTRAEALLQYTARERAMIERLEMIATGTAGQGAATDLEVARDVAREALEAVGWPVVQKLKQAESVPATAQ